MIARDLLGSFQEIGTWVDWDFTCDEFLHGDPYTEVRGVTVAWTFSNELLREAAAQGSNLVITHEPAFYDGFRGTPSADRLAEEKQMLLAELGLVVLRCHDTWDRMPEVGIVDSWAAHLGYPAKDRSVDSFYRVLLTEKRTVGQLRDEILERCRPLGQSQVGLLGDPDLPVGRLVIGTGAITPLPLMAELWPDAILATDDGMNFWDGGLWALDTGLPVLIVNHAVAEKPGMRALAVYLEQQFPELPVHYLDVPLPGPAG